MTQLEKSNFEFFKWCSDKGYNLEIFTYIPYENLDSLFLLKYGLRYSLYDNFTDDIYKAIYMLYHTKWDIYIEKYEATLKNIVSTGSSDTVSKTVSYSEDTSNTNTQDTTSYDDDTYSPDTQSQDTGSKNYTQKEMTENQTTKNITMNKINLLKYDFLCDIIFTDINKLISINFYNVYL